MRPFKKFLTMNQKDRQKPAKIKVLLAGHLPPPIGGIAAYYQSLLGSSLDEKVNLQFVQTSTHKRDLSQSGRATVSNFVSAARDCFRFFGAILSQRPHICHIGTAFGLSFVKHSICVFIARVFGSRVLLHPHCSLSALYSDRSAWWRWYFRRVLLLTNGMIGLSREWKQVLQIIPGSRVYLLQNAINLAPFQSIAQDRFENPMRDGDVDILYLGYLGRAKGSLDLVDATQHIDCKGSKIFFDLVGDELSPGELDHIHQKIDAAKLSKVVKIHPPVSGAKKLFYFRDADIFVYPSYSEGLPIAVIEAMASGLPIVASNIGGLPDLVREGVNGILVEPGRADLLATALLKIAINPQLRHSMGEKSAQIAIEEYDIEQHVLQLVSIYAKSI